MREAVVSMIFTHCSAENLMPQSTLMPTTDSNKLEISSIQKALRELKVSVVSDKQEKRLLKGGPKKMYSFKISLLYFSAKPASDLQNSCVYPP